MKNKFLLAPITILLLFFIYGLGETLLPLTFSLGLAYLLFPTIRKIEKKGIPRAAAVIAIFLSFIGLLTLLIVTLVPWLISEAKTFMNELPQNSTIALERFEELARRTGYPIDLSQFEIKQMISERAAGLSKIIFQTKPDYIRGIFSGFFGIILMVLNFALVPLFFFHTINDYEKISKEVKSLIPAAYKPRLDRFLELSNTVLSGYIRGQLLVVSLLAVLYATGFMLIGLRFGLLIGLMTGFLSIIPIVGGLLGFLAAVVVALSNFSGMEMTAWISIVFVTIQVLEGMVITPKLVGNKVGLGMLSTMLAIIMGGNLLGVLGMIVAIPAAAILKLVYMDMKKT